MARAFIPVESKTGPRGPRDNRPGLDVDTKRHILGCATVVIVLASLLIVVVLWLHSNSNRTTVPGNRSRIVTLAATAISPSDDKNASKLAALDLASDGTALVLLAINKETLAHYELQKIAPDGRAVWVSSVLEDLATGSYKVLSWQPIVPYRGFDDGPFAPHVASSNNDGFYIATAIQSPMKLFKNASETVVVAPPGSWGLLLAKFGRENTLEWHTTIESSAKMTLTDLAVDKRGGCILVGRAPGMITASPLHETDEKQRRSLKGGLNQSFLIRYSSTGDLLSAVRPEIKFEECSVEAFDDDELMFIADMGSSFSLFDEDGSLKWSTKCLQISGGGYRQCYSVAANGGAIVAGMFKGDGWTRTPPFEDVAKGEWICVVERYDQNGERMWQTSLGPVRVLFPWLLYCPCSDLSAALLDDGTTILTMTLVGEADFEGLGGSLINRGTSEKLAVIHLDAAGKLISASLIANLRQVATAAIRPVPDSNDLLYYGSVAGGAVFRIDKDGGAPIRISAPVLQNDDVHNQRAYVAQFQINAAVDVAK